MSIQPLADALASSRAVLAGVDRGQLEAPTPCASWNVGALINHLIDAQGFFQAGLAGAPPSTDEVDHSQGDFVAAYDEASRATLDAFGAEGVLGQLVKLPFGDMPGGAFMGLAVNDVFVHGWDLAKATGQSTDLNPALAEEVLAQAQASIRPDFRGDEGAPFGPEVEAPAGACAADRLAAFLGRSV